MQMVICMLLSGACLHADQNVASPNLSAIAEDFQMSALERDQKLGGIVQLGFFLIGGGVSLFIGPMADQMNRVEEKIQI